MTCHPPEGWESTSRNGGGKCPEGYTKSKRLVQGICEGRKTEFCCTFQHSGANGFCDDVIVNDKEKNAPLCLISNNATNCPKTGKKQKIKNHGGQFVHRLITNGNKRNLTVLRLIFQKLII